MEPQADSVKAIGDATAAVLAAGTILGWLPYIAAALTILWYAGRFATAFWLWWKHRNEGSCPHFAGCDKRRAS